MLRQSMPFVSVLEYISGRAAVIVGGVQEAPCDLVEGCANLLESPVGLVIARVLI